MRRGWIVLLAALTFVGTLAASPAVAGGSWLELREVQGTGAVGDDPWGGWVGPGATATMRGDFCDGQQAHPSAGPWTAYLSPDAGGPSIALSPVTIGPATGNACQWVASTTFVVPDVPTGSYWVHVCADPACTVGVGDLAGGVVTVARTATEAGLFRENTELRGRVASLARARDRQVKELEQLEAELRSKSEELATADQELLTAHQWAGSLADARDAVAADLRAARDGGEAWRLVAVASLAAVLLMLVLAGIWAYRRRRAGRIDVPDTPAELLRRQADDIGV